MSELVEDVVREAWPGARFRSEPVPILGGEWASLFRLSVDGVPAGVPGELVLRVMPQAELGAKDVAVQRAAADAGVSTPAIRLQGDAGGPLGAAWSVMDFTSGAPLIGRLDAASAVRGLAGIVRDVPDQLAQMMAVVHGVDPRALVDEVGRVAPSVGFGVDGLLARLSRVDVGSLAAAVDRLVGTRPSEADLVLCHGDLHPFNVLDDGERRTVIDWTGAVVAPAAFDVAFTRLLLRYPPMVVPGALRPVVSGGTVVLARRFVQRYHAARPSTDLSTLGWYTALHAARVLVDLESWRQVGDPRAGRHPYRLVAPGAARVLARVTGVEKSPGD